MSTHLSDKLFHRSPPGDVLKNIVPSSAPQIDPTIKSDSANHSPSTVLRHCFNNDEFISGPQGNVLTALFVRDRFNGQNSFGLAGILKCR